MILHSRDNDLKHGEERALFRPSEKEPAIVLVTLDALDNVHRELLHTLEDSDSYARPRACAQVAKDRLFIYLEQKKESRIGMIRFIDQ